MTDWLAVSVSGTTRSATYSTAIEPALDRHPCAYPRLDRAELLQFGAILANEDAILVVDVDLVTW
ncbi:MAG: hypothetical protein AAF467_11140 [Actinomycetota bacterium]